MLKLIKNSSVLLQHSRKSVQCCLVLNSMFTQITKTFLMLVTNPSDDSAGSPMLMNMGQNYTISKAHAMSLQTLSQGFCAMMRAHP